MTSTLEWFLFSASSVCDGISYNLLNDPLRNKDQSNDQSGGKIHLSFYYNTTTLTQ